MFRIYRNTIIAAGLILIIASPTLGQQGMPEGIESENGGQQASENHKPESAPKDQVAVPVKTEKTDLGPDNSTGDSQSAEYQEVLESYWSWNGFITPSDTLAQWLMALFGIVATGVSIWAVILLKCTLDESKCATNAAVHAAKAADETIKVTREAHQNERRPWILVEPEIVGNLVISDGKIDFSIKYKLTNFGPTPAVGVYWHYYTIFDFAYERSKSDEAREFAKSLSKNSPGETIFRDRDHQFVQNFQIPARETSAFMKKHEGLLTISPVVILAVAYRSALGGDAIMTTPCSRTIFLRTNEPPWCRGIPMENSVTDPPDLVLFAVSNAAPPD